jgi:ABC-type multidrug transport system fused ATPase/permease subunit
LQRSLDELMHGRTTLVVTTRKEEIERANSVVLLVEGQVVAQKPYAELVQDEEMAPAVLLEEALGFGAAAG